MTSPLNAGVTIPVDVLAILTDLQQQIADLTGIVDAQQQTLRDLNVIVQSQAHGLQQQPSRTAPSAALPSAHDVPVGA